MKKECKGCKYHEEPIYCHSYEKTGEICRGYDMWEPKEPDQSAKINGVAEEETVANEQGGKQSRLDYRFDLIDPKAIFALAQVLHEGAQNYEKDNWRKIDTESHLNHALSHIYAFLAGDKQDNHLSHAFTRLMMAYAVEKGE